jgi:hypothetical protein
MELLLIDFVKYKFPNKVSGSANKVRMGIS